MLRNKPYMESLELHNWIFERLSSLSRWEGKNVDEVGRCKETGVVHVKVDPKYFRPTEVVCSGWGCECEIRVGKKHLYVGMKYVFKIMNIYTQALTAPLLMLCVTVILQHKMLKAERCESTLNNLGLCVQFVRTHFSTLSFVNRSTYKVIAPKQVRS